MGARHTKASGVSPVAHGGVASAPRFDAPAFDDERAHLYEIIRTIGAGPDLDAILAGVVRLLTEATKCHACLIWYREGERLVLRASSPPYAHLAGAIRMELGEGLAGWVARTRRSAFIKENALEDPRVKYFPELEEEDFQSLVSVPMFDRDGDVMGVITLHAEAPHEFNRADLDFLEHTAWLMAGAVENARLYEESTARVTLLTSLSRLSQQVAATADVEHLVDIVATETRTLLSASRCEIYLVGAGEQLHLAAASPPRADAAVLPANVLSRDRPDRDAASTRSLARALWPGELDGAATIVPLAAGDERIGFLAVLGRDAPPGAEIALDAVAAHTAVAIRRHTLVEQLLDKNLVKEFFIALSSRDAHRHQVGALAEKIGFDLEAPHVVAHIAPWSPDLHRGLAADGTNAAGGGGATWATDVGRIEARLSAAFPGALFDRVDGTLRGLIPIRGHVGRTAEDLGAAAAAVETDAPALSIGVSSVRRGRDSDAGAFGEALAAAEVGGLLRAGPGVTTYQALGAYRYVLDAPGVAHDENEERLQQVVAYDRRRHTALLDTLERYIDNRGNLASTARDFYIHPNTLRQRLDRIRDESGIDPDEGDWLSLALAVKIVKLRRIRASTEEGRESHG
jgi:GAF domain-containing protein/transposase-like protein